MNSDDYSTLIKNNNYLLESLQLNSLNEIVKKCSEIFDSPVVLTNEIYQKLEMYPNHTIGDKVYDELVKEGEVSDDLLKNYIDSYLPKQEMDFDPFYVDIAPNNHENNYFMSRILGKIGSKKGVLGHFGILLGDKKLEAWHIETAKLFEKYLSILILNQPDLRIGDMATFHIWLDETLNISSNEDLRKKSYLNLLNKLPRPWNLLVSKISLTTDLYTYSKLLIEKLSKDFPNLILKSIGEYLYVLEGGADKKSEIQSIINILNENSFTSNILFRDRISLDIFANIKYISDMCFHICKQSHKKYIEIDELMSEIAAKLLLANPISCVFVDERINEMHNYDVSKGTEYLSTLCTLIENKFDRKITSSSMHIHRNTLLYRINKIKELFKIDFDDELEIRNLQFAIMLFKYSN